VDAIYEGKGSNIAFEPIKKILPGLQNLGGFRYSGRGYPKKIVALFSTREEKDWPDFLDSCTGEYSYYGDNRKPGFDLHDTRPGGNNILKMTFEDIHSIPNNRERVSPFLLFWKHPTPRSIRSVQFKGLAVPGLSAKQGHEDLVAVWRSENGRRFQNYLAFFTILDEAVIKRQWLLDILRGVDGALNQPATWHSWKKTGLIKALKTAMKSNIRDKESQLPLNEKHKGLLTTVYDYFKVNDRLFEIFAGEIFEMSDQRSRIDAVTRPTADGGRDAYGRFFIGMPEDQVELDFSLEAKCWQIDSGCGVKFTSRLISRIRHRQFGVFVTTSYVARQAYEEIRSDGHPIIIISGGDIAKILIRSGLNTPTSVREFLEKKYPL
jgi:hypothetical protein